MKKEIVCFGINNYPGSDNDLQECINDAIDWRDLLKNLGFTYSIYVDSQVTISLFLSELTRLVTTAVSGDHIVVSYSGHGTQVFDRSGDEADWYDEAIYLYDGALIDDSLYEIINNLKEGVILTIILDSCFSGTATKNLSGKKIRFIKTKLKGRKLSRKLKRRKQFLRADTTKNILIAGCSNSEYSYDAPRLSNGAFTYYAISSYKPGMTYTEFYTELKKKLPTEEYPQTPQLEGPIELLNTAMFGAVEVAPPVVVETVCWVDSFVENLKTILKYFFCKT